MVSEGSSVDHKKLPQFEESNEAKEELRERNNIL